MMQRMILINLETGPLLLSCEDHQPHGMDTLFGQSFR